MDITDTLDGPTRDAWRAWLHTHRDTADEIWLVFYRKHAAHPGVTYSDAVDEALCVGWIDGIRKKIDDDRYANRFTPRRVGSPYSQVNRERLARLHDRGLLHPAMVPVLDTVRPEAFAIPSDILAALDARPGARAFFDGMAPAYQRIRAAHVDSARARADEFQQRLDRLVEMSALGKTFGTGLDAYL